MGRMTGLVMLALGLGAVSWARSGAGGASDGVSVDKEKRLIKIDAKVAPRKLPNLKEVYPIEVIACWPHPKGKKSHETIVTIDVKPSEVHKALESLGLKPGKRVMGKSETAPEGPAVNVFIEVPAEGKPKRLSIDKILVDP